MSNSDGTWTRGVAGAACHCVPLLPGRGVNSTTARQRYRRRVSPLPVSGAEPAERGLHPSRQPTARGAVAGLRKAATLRPGGLHAACDRGVHGVGGAMSVPSRGGAGRGVWRAGKRGGSDKDGPHVEGNSVQVLVLWCSRVHCGFKSFEF